MCWGLLVAAIGVVTALTMLDPVSAVTWENPEMLFSLVTVSAAACIFGATVVIALADRRDMAEIGLLGAAMMVTSVMPLVHGLTTPGVLYDSTEAFAASSFLALPVAVAVAFPLLASRTSLGRWAARHWRDWTLLALLGVFVLASIVVFFPDWIDTPDPHAPVTVAMSVGTLAAIVALSVRQLRLYDLGDHPSHLVAAIAFALLSVTALLPTVETAYSAAFWWLHLAGALGVAGVSVGMIVSKRMTRSAQDILAPVLVRDPLVAFELGLSPVVHRFVSDLERKDQLTRDHVVRTGELAIRVGERMNLKARDLRDLGLAAMLHDIGKLRTPDEILKKPSSLSAEEYEVIKLHPVHGAEMLAAEPTLSSCAPIVRSHHERIDGAGYPDGLAGDAIPLPARIIAVCDAIDAMTHDRQYRKAMPLAMGFAILREHAGSQWDDDVVRYVMATLPTMPAAATFDRVGRAGAQQTVFADDVVIPDDIGAILAAVDAEI